MVATLHGAGGWERVERAWAGARGEWVAQELAGAAALRAAAGGHVRFTCVDGDGATVVLGANTGSLYVFHRSQDALSLQRIVYPEQANGLGLTVSSVYSNLLLRKKGAGDGHKEGDALVAVRLSPSAACCATVNGDGVLAVVWLRAAHGAPLSQPLHVALCRDVHSRGASERERESGRETSLHILHTFVYCTEVV